MPSRPRLYLIDGHALAYRTYFALTRAGDSSRWTTRAGEPTAGVYGFTSVLFRLLEQEAPDYLAVSFDTGRTFRDDLYAEYKATRDKMPEDLVPQLERIRQVVAAFGIPILEADGYEADDVLGTVARRAASAGAEVLILTGDRDLLQLADRHIHIQLSGQRLAEAQEYGPAEVKHRYGVSPAQLVDFKALVGDASDNIPGVRGIGEKTAADLLQRFGTLEALYARLDEAPPRVRKLLEEGRPQAELSRRLARIETEVPLDFELEGCRVRPYDRAAVAALFRELEFRSLLDRLPDAAPATRQQLSLFQAGQAPAPAGGPARVLVVNDGDGLARLLQVLSAAPAVALDVETTGLDPLRAELVGISLAVQPGEGYYLPLGHDPALAGGPQLERAVALEALRRPLTAPDHALIGHNLKYDYAVLARAGLRPAPLAFDTMLAEWLIDPASRNLGLKNLAWVRLGLEMTEIHTLIGTGKDQRSMASVPIGQVAPYAAADAEVCLRLLPGLERDLAERQQSALFRELEMPLVPLLAEMELAGVCLDRAFLERMSAELGQRLAQIERTIYEQVGREFNLNSTQQLARALFEDLGLTPPDRTRKTASGQYSTAASVLDELRGAHPVIEHILQHREISKLKSTYTDALPQQIHPETGRVHTSYSQTGAVTGRLASSDPNLQNIPIRTELGRRIRRAFIAAPGQALLSVDYSQIELRIVAHLSEDPAMLQAFLDDQDIHTATASAILGLPPQAVTSEARRQAKAVNFGLIYGMSAYGLSRSTDLTLAEAEAFVKAYFERFPGVRRYLDQARREAATRGYVETLLGRRRYFPQLVRGEAAIPEAARARAEREAVNAPIQGTASDIIKRAMLRLPPALAQAGLQARMLLQVHDELVFECPRAELQAATRLVQQVMQEAYTLRVPLKTDARAGPNWADLEPVA